MLEFIWRNQHTCTLNGSDLFVTFAPTYFQHTYAVLRSLGYYISAKGLRYCCWREYTDDEAPEEMVPARGAVGVV